VFLPPGQNYQWVERGGQVFAGASAVPDAWTGADLIAFNSDGSAALLYRSSGKAQVITGLPGAAIVSRETAAPASATAIAISDDANTLLLTSGQGVFAASKGEPWQLVMAGSANAIAFVPGGSDALLAMKDQSYLLKGSQTAQFLTGDSASAVATSADGRLAVLLSTSGTEAILVDMQSRATQRLPLGSAAKDIQRGRDGAIIFTPRQGTSPWLLDTSSRTLSFAPALPETAGGR
jgi:hypothetical protein